MGGGASNINRQIGNRIQQAQTQAAGKFSRPAAMRAAADAKLVQSARGHRDAAIGKFNLVWKSANAADIVKGVQAHVGQEAAGELLDALGSGKRAMNAMNSQQPGAAQSKDALMSQARQVADATVAMVHLSAAHQLFTKASQVGPQSSLTARWAALSGMNAAASELAQLQGSRGGVFDQAALTKTAGRMQQVYMARARTLEAQVLQEASPKARELIAGQRELQRHVQSAQAQLRTAQAGSPAAQAAQKSLDVLNGAMKQLDEDIRTALSPGAPRDVPAAKKWFPTLSRWMGQNAATKAAARGGSLQFTGGLEPRFAVAAHLKGVLQRAGLTGGALPSRTQLRQQMDTLVQPHITKAAQEPITDLAKLRSLIDNFPVPDQGKVQGKPQPQPQPQPMSEPELIMSPEEEQAALDELEAMLLEDQVNQVSAQADQLIKSRQKELDQVTAKVMDQAREIEKRNAKFMDMLAPGNDAELMRELEDMERRLKNL